MRRSNLARLFFVAFLVGVCRPLSAIEIKPNLLASLCAEQVALWEADLGPEAAAMMLAGAIGNSPVFASGDTKLQDTVVKTIDQFKAAGYSPMSAILSVSGIVDAFGVPGMTPEALKLILRRSQDEARVLTLEPRTHSRVLTLSELGLSPQNPRLQQTLNIFARTGLSIFATDAHAHAKFSGELVCSGLAIVPSELFSQESVEDMLRSSILHALCRPGNYLPIFSNRGVHLPSHLIPSSTTAVAMHEVSHAVQDVSWELRGLLAAFAHDGLRQIIAQVVPDPPTDAVWMTGYKTRIWRFLHMTLDPKHRRDVWTLGNHLQLSPKEWTLFIDLVNLLFEYDAHQQANLLLGERGTASPQFQGDNLVAFVREVYGSSGQGVLSPAIEHLKFPTVYLQQLVDELNEGRQFRQSIREWAHEKWFGRSRPLRRPINPPSHIPLPPG